MSKTRAHVGPNMTPMVDVVMCILIFFMLGSSFVAPEMFLKSNTAAIDKGGMGSEEGTQKLPARKMSIALGRAGKEGIDGNPGDAITWVKINDNGPSMAMDRETGIKGPSDAVIEAALRELRKKTSDEVQVLIKPAEGVPWQDVITVYDYCTKLQFKQVAFYPVK